MKNRYVSGPSRSGYYDYSVGDHVLMPDSCTVVEIDKSPIETGLLDANGHRLFRLPETVEIGFHKR
jgi:hypothetical protein